ncbi:MAG: amidohydrolase family protein [Candidatus Aminicenantes bacterium]|nr:MAG: amidohydrolase family protein [Candidatus Aminicenantes bacterium]
MTKKTLILSTILIFCSLFCFADVKSPGIIAIKSAHIVPVVGDDITDGIILIKDGKIEAIGKNITIPEDARVIDATGLFAYPGMIDGLCSLALYEIGSLRATIDSRETGRINPQLKTVEALRPDSIHVPIARANGITTAHIVPSGGIISGQSGLIRLNGWIPEEMIVKSSVAMHIQFPSVPRSRRGETQPREEPSKQIKELKEILNKARYYQKRKEAAQKKPLLPIPEFDEQLEFLLPVVKGELPVFISVYTDKDIKAAIKFVNDEKLKAIFYGVTEGWKVADEIKKSGIPVVFGSLYAMPTKWEDGYDAIFRNPGVLAKAGVKFAFSSQSATLAKDLPYHASRAAAFGLDRREALKGVTIYPAQIFGVDEILGSLEKGKVATIILTDGDILELRTNIKHVFIDGKEVDLSNRYTELLEKYKKRY